MKDYLIEIKVRNGRMLRKMNEVGIETAADLHRLCGASQAAIGQLLNLKISALTAFGDIRELVLKIAEALRCLPEDIIPKAHWESALARNKSSFEGNLEDVEAITASLRPALPDRRMEVDQAKQQLIAAVCELPERERFVIMARFGLEDGVEHTLKEIGETLNVCSKRVLQIEANALRRLRAPWRAPKEAFAILVREEASLPHPPAP